MKKIQKEVIKAAANTAYDIFESAGLTVEQAARMAEKLFALAESKVWLYRTLRNDISTHMGESKDTFDRDKHTHRFSNL